MNDIAEAVLRLGQAIGDLCDEDSRASRRRRIDAVALSYAQLIKSFVPAEQTNTPASE